MTSGPAATPSSSPAQRDETTVRWDATCHQTLAVALNGEKSWTGWEVHVVERRVVTKEVMKRFAVRSTKTSAQLERRAVPAGYMRSERVERFLAERLQRI